MQNIPPTFYDWVEDVKYDPTSRDPSFVQYNTTRKMLQLAKNDGYRYLTGNFSTACTDELAKDGIHWFNLGEVNYYGHGCGFPLNKVPFKIINEDEPSSIVEVKFNFWRWLRFKKNTEPIITIPANTNSIDHRMVKLLRWYLSSTYDIKEEKFTIELNHKKTWYSNPPDIIRDMATVFELPYMQCKDVFVNYFEEKLIEYRKK